MGKKINNFSLINTIFYLHVQYEIKLNHDVSFIYPYLLPKINKNVHIYLYIFSKLPYGCHSIYISANTEEGIHLRAIV